MNAPVIIDARSPRAKQDGSASDNWCTPTWFTDMLPPVDLDPFSNAHATVDADTKWTLEAGDDGEATSWAGFRHAYWNPRYSNPKPACQRAADHANFHGGESIGLLKLDPTTQWWSVLVRGGATFYPLRKRVTFAPGPGLVTGCTANFPSVVVHLGPRRHFAGFLFDLVDQGHAWRF